jgi:hypothetical protein
MAYEETSQEKQRRQAKEADWAAKGKAAEAKQDYEAFGSRGDAARKGMEEGRMDAMGNAYKKGGKVMEHTHKMEHEKKHAAGFQHEQDKATQHSGGHKMFHEHVKTMNKGGKAC